MTAAGIGSFQASSDAVEFGNVQVGKTASHTLTLINQGTAAVSVSNLKVTGNQFTVASPNSLPVTVAANSSLSIDVQFKPKASGDSTGQLTVSSSSQKSPSLKVKLHGNGAPAGSNTTPTLSSLFCSQSSITGTGSDTCTANLTEAAGSGGLTVTLSSNDGAVTVPASLTVPSGATSAGFTATITAVTTAQTATLTASAGGATHTFGISLGAVASGSEPGVLSGLSCSQNSITGSGSDTCTVALNGAATGNGLVVNLASNQSAVTVPATVTVPSGATSAGFTATVAAVTTAQTATLTASAGGATQTFGISLGAVASGSGPGVLSGLSCSQNSITGSGSDTCTVTLNGAATGNGLVVNLASNQSAVTVPATVTVPSGATSAGFTASIAAVTTAQTATLTASASGATQTFGISLGAFMPKLKMSTASLNFGGVTKNTKSAPLSVMLTSSGTAPLTINSAVASGAGFTVSGTTLPATLNPGQTASLTVIFDPTVTGAANGAISISDNASPSTAAISLSGMGQSAPGVLGGLSCSQNSITGAGSDTCTVTLTAAAGSSGLAVSLSSNNNAVTVPGAVTVPAGSSSIGFTAAVSAVTTAQSDTLTASAGGVAENYSISLGASTPSLTVGTGSLAFGSVNLNAPATQPVTLTSSGTAPVTISAGSATGAGFSISGVSFPATLNPGQVATLYVQFDPTQAGAASGTVTLTSNASPSTQKISLSGTGESTLYQVTLTWNAPSSSTDPVAGYNIYRATGTSSSYQLMNSSPQTSTGYTDTSVSDGTTYNYYVESVDAEGNQSSPSNTYAANIP